MTILRTGSNKKYSDNWAKAFSASSKKKAKPTKKKTKMTKKKNKAKAK